MGIENFSGKPELPESSEEYIDIFDAFHKLGQSQYVSRFLNPDPICREDGTPYFDDIRIAGDPDSYHDLKIHKDDVRKFVEHWLEYKKQINPLSYPPEKTVEDFLSEESE